MSETILERYGRGALTRVVSAFYRKVLESPMLAGYFAGLHMNRLISHQTAFMTTVMGGPESYTPERIAEAHQPLSISGADFTEMLRLLEETLLASGILREDTDQIIAAYRSFEPHVVRSTAERPGSDDPD